jgi:hypothetical protein
MRLRLGAVAIAAALCACPAMGGQRQDVLDPATGRRVGTIGESMPGSHDLDFRDSQGRTRAILRPDGSVISPSGRRILEVPQGRTDSNGEEWRPVEEWQGGQGEGE